MGPPATEWLWPYADLVSRLQYPLLTPQNTDSFHNAAYYTTGPLDLVTIVAFIAAMAVLRDVLRLYVFEPFSRWKLMRDWAHKRKSKAKSKPSATANGYANGHSNGHANGHSNGHANGHANGSASETAKPTKKELRQMHRSILRFAEQGWFVVYYTFSWSYGLYIHLSLPTELFDLTALWVDYPHIPLPGPIKFYYLIQTACYIHQVLILNAEARRKDHWQMMAHHVITVTLLFLSYYTNFTRIGCVIMLLMDFCDIFLPFAKMMRYINIPQLYTDATFGFFMVSWLVSRHFLYVLVIWSQATQLPQYVPFIIDPERGYYMSQHAYWAFLLMLVSLEILQGIWFWMICRVAWRVVMGVGADDERSEDEFDDDNDRKTD